MSVAKQMLLEQLELDAVEDDKQFLADYYGEEDWQLGETTYTCVWCGEPPDGEMYYSHDMGMGCHTGCVECIQGFAHSMGKD